MIVPRRKLIITTVIIVGVVALAFFVATLNQPTYVRIVDASSIPTDTSPAPGADINAVSIIKNRDKKTVYASAIAATKLTDGSGGTPNQAKDAASILGSENTDQTPKYVSLGIGGSIIVRVDASIGKGDQLIVYEIGSEGGARAEYYTVSTSKNANGPWKDLGTFAGPHTFTF